MNLGARRYLLKCPGLVFVAFLQLPPTHALFELGEFVSQRSRAEVAIGSRGKFGLHIHPNRFDQGAIDDRGQERFAVLSKVSPDPLNPQVIAWCLWVRGP